MRLLSLRIEKMIACLGLAVLLVSACPVFAQAPPPPGPPKPAGPPPPPKTPPPPPGPHIYNDVPAPLPGNVASEGPEAYAFSELGDGVVFTKGTGGTFDKVTVVMSNWACEHGHWYIPVGTVGTNGDGPCVTQPGPGAKFSQAITLKIYGVSGTTPGAVLASTTQTFQIPFRPSSDAKNCSAPNGDGEQWYNAPDKTCYHGLAVPITFDLAPLHIPIPSTNQAIITLSYNTSDYGPQPQRPQACNSLPAPDNDNCPYDSLNISTDNGGENTPPTNLVFAGSFLDPDSIFVNYANLDSACPSTTKTGTLTIDAGCWAGFHPEIQVSAAGRKQTPPKPGPPTP